MKDKALEKIFREIEKKMNLEPYIIEAGPRVYTFAVPAKKGYYYLALEASTEEEASTEALNISARLPEASGIPRSLSVIKNIDALVIKPSFKERFQKFGHAHTYKRVRLAPFHVRHGYRGSLLE